MSYLVESFFDGAWAHTDCLIFATEHEASEYAKAAKGRGYRLKATTESANYRWRDGKLVPGVEPVKTLRDFMSGGMPWGIGMPLVDNELQAIGRRYAQALQASMRQTLREALDGLQWAP